MERNEYNKLIRKNKLERKKKIEMIKIHNRFNYRKKTENDDRKD